MDPQLSLLVPCHNEEANLRPLYDRLCEVLEPLCSFEIILVDDGSLDGTWQAAAELHGADSRVRALRFTRNFGKEAAIVAALNVARGEAVVSLDADLQHPPEVIPQLVERWRAGAKIVTTKRIYGRATSRMRKVSSSLFYQVFSWLAGVPLSGGSSDFRLLDREVVLQLRRFRQGDFFYRGMVAWLGLSGDVVEFEAAPRHAGRTSYSWRRIIGYGSSVVVSFSVLPLRLAIVLGLLASGFAFAEIVYVVIQFHAGRSVPGWASVVGLMALFFGIQFVLIGLLGEYIGRIHLAVKDRPAFIVWDRFGLDSPDVRAGETEREGAS